MNISYHWTQIENSVSCNDLWILWIFWKIILLFLTNTRRDRWQVFIPQAGGHVATSFYRRASILKTVTWLAGGRAHPVVTTNQVFLLTHVFCTVSISPAQLQDNFSGKVVFNNPLWAMATNTGLFFNITSCTFMFLYRSLLTRRSWTNVSPVPPRAYITFLLRHVKTWLNVCLYLSGENSNTVVYGPATWKFSQLFVGLFFLLNDVSVVDGGVDVLLNYTPANVALVSPPPPHSRQQHLHFAPWSSETKTELLSSTCTRLLSSSPPPLLWPLDIFLRLSVCCLPVLMRVCESVLPKRLLLFPSCETFASLTVYPFLIQCVHVMFVYRTCTESALVLLEDGNHKGVQTSSDLSMQARKRKKEYINIWGFRWTASLEAGIHNCYSYNSFI